METINRIVCIGWGSLIWDPRSLRIKKEWFTDGPALPIEFTRISKDDRVTLIIDTQTDPVQTLWANMTTLDFDGAITSLKEREDTSSKNIHSVSSTDTTTDPVKLVIRNWLISKELDTAIWTGLSYSRKTHLKRPTIQKIISHLNALDPEAKKTAEEYIRKAPKQIVTSYRQVIEDLCDWTLLI